MEKEKLWVTSVRKKQSVGRDNGKCKQTLGQEKQGHPAGWGGLAGLKETWGHLMEGLLALGSGVLLSLCT